MTDAAPFNDSRDAPFSNSRGGPRWRATWRGLLLMALVGIVSTLGVPLDGPLGIGTASVWADDEVDLTIEPDWAGRFDDTARAFEASFLRVGNGEPQWQGLLKAMRKAPDPRRALEAVLTPLLDPGGALAGRSADNRNKLLVRVMVELLERGLDDPEAPFILADEMMRTLEAFGEELLGKLLAANLEVDLKTNESRGWRRLIEHALDRVANVPTGPLAPGIYSSAVWVLGRAPEVDGFRALEALLQIVDRKPSAIAGSPLALLGEDTLRQALTALLGRPWRDLASVSAWADLPEVKVLRKSAGAEARNDSILKSYIRLLKNLLRQPSDAEDLAARYGQQLAQERSSLEGLKELMYPGLSPLAAVRRAAMARAGELAPEASSEWVDVLVRVLDEEDDEEVIRRLLTVIAQPGFEKKTEQTPALVDALVARLSRLGGADDPVDIRRKLVAGIAGMGGSRGLWASIREMQMLVFPPEARRPDEKHLAVYLDLIERAGQAEGTTAVSLAQLWWRARDGESVLAPASVRRIVAEGLRRNPVRKKARQARIASALLRCFLEGEANETTEILDDLTLPPMPPGGEDDADVRATLIASLRYYPSEPTVATLARLLTGGAPTDLAPTVEALAAMIESDGNVQAAEALMGIYEREQPQVRDQQMRMLRAFAGVPKNDETQALRERLCTFARGLFDRGVGRPEAQLATLDILIGCADAESFGAAIERWRAEAAREDGTPAPWAAGLEKLALAVAGRDAEQDAVLLEALAGLAATSEGETAERVAAEQKLAFQVAEKVFEATKRAPFLELRLAALAAARDDEARENSARLEAGRQLVQSLEALAKALEGDARAAAYTRAYDAALALGGLGAVEGWFSALEVAAASGHKPLVARALRGGAEGEAQPLKVLQESSDLDEAAVARRTELEQKLQALDQQD